MSDGGKNLVPNDTNSVPENTNSADDLNRLRDFSPLLPERHPQLDLFVCDVADAILKDMTQHLEHPFYSLSKKPETQIKRYENNGHWIEITPSVKGVATIYDKDILIYCISQIMAKLHQGERVSRRVRINSRELLMFINRGTGGREYQSLIDALDRLEGTRIRTNIRSGDEEQLDGFGLIDASQVRRKHGRNGRLLWCDVILSDWVFNAIQNAEVLTLHRDYFRLRKPIERRVYEIARKHCGHQDEWKISVDKLRIKTGSQSDLKKFRHMIKDLVKYDHLPDYRVSYDDKKDMVVFKNRGTMQGMISYHLPPQEDGIPPLKPETYLKAKEAAPGWDVYYLEQEWRSWSVEAPRDADRAFVGFCTKWFARHGRPR